MILSVGSYLLVLNIRKAASETLAQELNLVPQVSGKHIPTWDFIYFV